jgi:hypothetical protein
VKARGKDSGAKNLKRPEPENVSSGSKVWPKMILKGWPKHLRSFWDIFANAFLPNVRNHP